MYLTIKATGLDEKCELIPISESDLVGRSRVLGEFRIVLDRTDDGELDRAVFENGLRRMVIHKVDE